LGLLEELRGEATSIAAEKTLASVELVNTTPGLVGSWDATGYVRCSCSGGCHPDLCVAEPPRPTDIAGKTRWWLRAILAAGYYEAHQGFPSLDRLDQLASKILGSTREASRYTIALEAYTPRRVRIPSTIVGNSQRCRETTSRLLAEQCCSPSSDSAYVLEDCAPLAKRSRRAWLATLGHRGAERTRRLPLPPGFYRFRLRVEERPTAQRSRDHGLRELEQRLLGTALAMALFFTGIGRMTTRGYGKLAPLAWSNTGTPLEEAIKETWELLVKGELDKLINTATRVAKRYICTISSDMSCTLSIGLCTQPIYSVFHRSFVNYCRAEIKGQNVWDMLKSINDLTRVALLEDNHNLNLAETILLLLTLGLPRGGNVFYKACIDSSGRKGSRALRLTSALTFTPLLSVDSAESNGYLYVTYYRYSYEACPSIARHDAVRHQCLAGFNRLLALFAPHQFHLYQDYIWENIIRYEINKRVTCID